MRGRGVARRATRGVRELLVYWKEGLGLAAATRPAPEIGETTSSPSPEPLDAASFPLPGRANAIFKVLCLLRLTALFFIYCPRDIVNKYSFLGGEKLVVLITPPQVFIFETDTSETTHTERSSVLYHSCHTSLARAPMLPNNKPT